MTMLVMLNEATGVEWRVWPDPEPVALGLVHETGSYLFEFRENADCAAADFTIDDVPLEALRAPTASASKFLPVKP
jgi:hypothetical protein